jgi:hypothetical protein
MEAHRWRINRERHQYVHEMTDNVTLPKPKWLAKGFVNLEPTEFVHKCGGKLFDFANVPALVKSIYVCWKCSAEISR